MKKLAYVFLFLAIGAKAQTVDLEKTFEVSKDAMKGFIHTIQNDESKEQLNVVYRVRAKKDQAKFITYTFDYNFNLVNQGEEVISFEKELPAKYKPKKYRGEDYSVEGLFVEPNIFGNLVLKRKVTTFSWNWLQLAYTLNTSVEGKLKAKTDDDKKLFYHDHIEDVNSGTALILAGEKGKPKDGPYNHMMNFHFLKYDVNLNKLADVPLNFETPQAVVTTYGLPADEDATKTDMIVVFATFKEKRYMGPKIWGKDATEYTYVRVSYDGKLLDKATFNVKNSIWKIDDFVFGKDGSVYFFGPSNDETDDFYHLSYDYKDEKKKWPRFQLAKFQNGKVQFVTSTSMEDFKTKLKPQPDGKKGDPYTGRKIKFTEAVISPANEVILAGQNFGFARNGKGQVVGKEFEDLVMFHFDANGNLISQYTMNKKKASTTPDAQNFEFGSDGKTLYWTYFDVVDTKMVKELSFVVDKPLGVPKMGKINLSTGTFDKYTEYGKGENFAHYGGILNYLKFSNTNQVNFLGENKKGSALWFVRVNLDK
jgi:hypothetical protein